MRALVLCVGAMLAGPAAFSHDGPNRRFTEVRIQPERLELSGPYDSAQILVSGRLENGLHVDLTREATLVTGSELVDVDSRGRIVPIADGDAVLELEVEGHRLSLPVSIQGTLERFVPNFHRDVEPVLSRAGCNAGTCHGSQQGRKGFRLSLRGYDPLFDWRTLTDELAGRRFNRADPERSLFLLKPSAQVPHEGGMVLEKGSRDYRVLRDWVAQGVRYEAEGPRVVGLRLLPQDPTVPAPGVTQQFVAIASFSDGTERDVSDHVFIESSDIEIALADETGLVRTLRRGGASILARYEGHYASTRLFVMGDRSEFEWTDTEAWGEIDRLVYERLREIKTQPSEVCADAEFLRRVRLDLTGLLPDSREVRTFLLDQRPSAIKRQELIDRLLGSVEFVDHWTHKWSDLLQVNPKFLGEDGANRFGEWIRQAVVSNTPYDQFVHDILTGSGSTAENPTASYFKILRTPDGVMENTTQLFLGVRFNCNKCHDHPFERWTRNQHWEMAAYFAQVGRADVPGSAKMPASTAMQAGESPPAFDEVISDLDSGTMISDDGATWEPSYPYSHEGAVNGEGTRREQLADWLTSVENDYFALSYVNRIWSYFLGRGLIEPVDDIRAGNPPTHPDLLDWLTTEFVAHDFDVRWLMRTICQSRVYQHSLETNRWNEDDEVHGSHALARRLSAETLWDAVHRAMGSRPQIPGTLPGTRAATLVGPSVKTSDGFLDLFGRPPRESSCECERKDGMSLGQALNLVNGPTLAEAVRDPTSELSQLVEFEPDDQALLDEIFLRFLGRFPEESERDFAQSFDPNQRTVIASLEPERRSAYDAAFHQWAKSIHSAAWEVLEIASARSAAGATLALQEDGSILASGPAAEKDTYTLVAWTGPGAITGLRLELLPDDSLPARGPGRADNGNLVLTNFTASAQALQSPAGPTLAEFSAATTGFSQAGWPIAESITANLEKGWALAPQIGRVHRGTFELKQDLGAAEGSLLVISLDQQHGIKHTLGRFRLQVTRSPRPIRHPGVPDDVAAALAVPEAERDESQRDLLHGAFLQKQKGWATELRRNAVQDLAWALANSPAFLFNH